MQNQSYQVRNRIMILNEIDTINSNRAYLDEQLQRSRNELRSLQNENRRIENERRNCNVCSNPEVFILPIKFKIILIFFFIFFLQKNYLQKKLKLTVKILTMRKS